MKKSLIVREGPRALVKCPYYYFAGESLCKGTVWEMSASGWRASSEQPVEVGTRLTLYIGLPTENGPEWICIGGAQVRWAHGLDFGLEISDVDDSSKVRLERFLDPLLAD